MKKFSLLCKFLKKGEENGKCKIFLVKFSYNTMSKDKMIAVPAMEYYDKAKTKPKFYVEVWDNNDSLRLLEHLNADGKRDGLSEYWLKNGQKYREQDYVDDKLHGLNINWHENGEKWKENNYIDGKRQGLHTAWYNSGQKWHEENYKDGKLHGLWTQWYENGQKESEWNYKDNELHGLWTTWYENGQKESEWNFKDGKRHGEWKHFDEQGELTKTEMWENGQLVKEPNENHRFSNEEVQPAI